MVNPQAKQLQDNVVALFKDLIEEGRKYVERDCVRPADDDSIDAADDDGDGEAEQ